MLKNRSGVAFTYEALQEALGVGRIVGVDVDSNRDIVTFIVEDKNKQSHEGDEVPRFEVKSTHVMEPALIVREW